MEKKVTQAIIFAGGLGERLKPFTENNPKPMYPINGKPFIEYLVEQIKSFGISDIIILLGYLHEKVEDYFGDGTKFGVNIRYVVTPVECDTELRLKGAKDILNDEFLMMYCDNICPINFERLCDNYFSHDALIELSIYDNSDNWTKSNIIIEENKISNAVINETKESNDSFKSGKVIIYDKKRLTPNLKYVDIGYAIVSKKVIDYMDNANNNFESIVYPKVLNEKKLYATVTKHRYYSIGSFERIEYTKKFLSNQKYIFIDRDGTLNVRPKKAEYIVNPEDFIWIDGAKTAIKKLNDAGYFVILISNQAGIARGAMSEDNFYKVQKKMGDDLKVIGAHIDAVYFCPHGWDDNCECRKPKPGLIYKAQKDYSINLSNCVMIGDDERDIITANNADMKGILVDDNYKFIDAVNDLLNGVIKEYKIL
ncbi:MAG: HAD-IIIA family hydrolase [Lachnospiraceae bacterium]|nr:HAD-IIIA family hydrolase [Lachnospiraceae bacterium]